MNQEVTYYPKEKVLQAVNVYKTPFFIYEEKRLLDNCQKFKNAFVKYFPDFRLLYAIKANPNSDIVRIIHSEGIDADCSSEAEAYLCEKLGINGMYTGNYNSQDEFRYIKNKDLIINLDDISMVPTLEKMGMPETISFRINPGAGKATIESNVFAGPNAKYGVPFEQAPQAYALAKKAGVKHFGIHMMTGSNVPISEQDYFANIVKKLFEVIANIKKETGIEIDFMNIGGGFGVPCHPSEKSLDLDALVKSIRAVVDEQCEFYGLKEPQIIAEPGRYLTANVGWLVGSVTVIKDGYKKFVGLDASTNDMPRTAIYGAYHHISVITDEKNEEEVAIVGRICENNDQFSKGMLLPICNVGDIVLIHNSGGHGRAMAHNYNGRLRHAEYLIQLDGQLKQIRECETIEDLYKGTNL